MPWFFSGFTFHDWKYFPWCAMKFLKCRAWKFVAHCMSIKNVFILLVAISQALILIAFWHNLVIVGLAILFAPEFITNPDFLDLLLPRTDTFPVVGVLSLLGYLGLVIACLSKGRRRSVFYFNSLIILWWSIAYLIVPRDSFEIMSSFPFVYVPFLFLSLTPLF